jgi:hypothetical protein
MMRTYYGVLSIALCALLAMAVFAPQASQAQGDKAENAVVRQLKFTPANPMVMPQIGGQSKVTTLASAAALERLVGREDAKSLADQVDFEKEMIVLVSWTTSGPPEGVLSHEVKGTG